MSHKLGILGLNKDLKSTKSNKSYVEQVVYSIYHIGYSNLTLGELLVVQRVRLWEGRRSS